MSNIDKQAGEGDVSPKTYFIHPAAFGSTKNPGYGHVAVVKAEDFEKLRAKLEAAEKRNAEMESLLSAIGKSRPGGAYFCKWDGKINEVLNHGK
ncbi:hypothetical protein OGY61_17570 [Citrobacter sp. CK196]|uniref:hypothetical protein n=1 Tax=Citrobacter TaxID=544 RepID=UPI002005B1AA|nr:MULTISPECIES: hypothetical protein [Citrobacter]MCK7562567.1 hypothetical protein [Citrobacter koseri]MDM2987657.1 hypothetical protein [Citrobacter sp. CK196]